MKGAASCTVDEGHFQLETDLFNAALKDAGGTSTNTYLFTSPTLKYGLTDRFDVEINMVPYETVETRDDHSGQHSRLSGAGDLYLRAKYNLFGNGGDGPGLALYPYVKAPTAGNGLGNGAWDGGLIVPASFGLPDNCALAVTPEIDIVEDADQTGIIPPSPRASGSPSLSAISRSVERFGERGFRSDPDNRAIFARFRGHLGTVRRSESADRCWHQFRP